MYIFAIITDLHIINLPSWYKEFTNKYLSRPIPHITLIQPRYIEEKAEHELIKKLTHDLKKYQKFLSLKIQAKGFIPFDEHTGFMIQTPHKHILNLQKTIRKMIPKELELYFPPGIEYEQNFRPHLTMADLIPENEFTDIVKKYNLEELHFDVEVHSILFTLTKDFSNEENMSEENHYKIL